jgi:4-methylaminobutanoate oxidase (formaldehyde-forming)
MSSLRLEKGYRDIGVTSTTPTTPSERGLGFTIAWDKPGGFVGRDALLEFKAQGPPRNRGQPVGRRPRGRSIRQ